ncbi:MAG: hypothetical protein M9934_03735 [Thermomicrobiales bacterium]|nr:hypothetical protein [Thermomicrobiales bacterium]
MPISTIYGFKQACSRPGMLFTPGRLLVLAVVITLMIIALGQEQSSAADANQRPTEVAGTVLGEDGLPIANAWVTDGEHYTFTDAQGNFVFASGKVVPGTALIVSSSGYGQEQFVAPPDGDPVEIVMDPFSVRGIYFNPLISNTPAIIDAYIQIARTTEVNAVVIDVKENVIYFDTNNELFQDANMVLPILDLPELLRKFHENGIYTIARIVVFKDSPVAVLHPEYAVKDTWTGGLWRDQNGAAWVNPLHQEMWDANIDLAAEVIEIGFDEVQYDYVRFPTDGDMSRADFGAPVTEEVREAAIKGFLERSRARIIPLGGRQSADIFGYTTVVDHDLGIGQNLDQLAGIVDYLSPMIYPSHWPDRSLYGVPGRPNDYPYLTVQISMSSAVAQLDGNTRKFRPWLQDFGMPGMYTYGVPEVRAQIDALRDVGITSWLIWSPSNWFHTGAFAPDSEPDRLPTATPYSATPVARRTWSTVNH